MMYLIFNVNSLSYFRFEKSCGANSLSYFRFEKGLETEMAWKRLFNTFKKIFSHNWPPAIARRVYCHCAPSSRQNTRSVILRSNRCSAVHPIQSQMFHVKQNVRSNEQVFGVTLKANVRLPSHEKYKYKMWGKKYRTLVRQCIPPLNTSKKFQIFYKKVLTALCQYVIMFT